VLFIIGAALLVVWAIGAAGPFAIGEIVHALLLAGLWLLLLAFLKARDAAAHARGAHAGDEPADRSPRR
jgi:fatty acid desaturase